MKATVKTVVEAATSEVNANTSTAKEVRGYIVTNVYGITCESEHRTPKAALRECSRREGDGWIVVDLDGNQWDGTPEAPVIVRFAENQEKV